MLCPFLVFKGEQCDGGDFDPIYLYNEKQASWDKDILNDYEVSLKIDPEVVEIGKQSP